MVAENLWLDNVYAGQCCFDFLHAVQFRINNGFSLRNGLQMFAIGTFSIAGGRRKKRVTVDPAIPLGDLFRRGDLDGLTLFDHAHKIRCVDQTVHRTGV